VKTARDARYPPCDSREHDGWFLSALRPVTLAYQSYQVQQVGLFRMKACLLRSGSATQVIKPGEHRSAYPGSWVGKAEAGGYAGRNLWQPTIDHFDAGGGVGRDTGRESLNNVAKLLVLDVFVIP